MKKECELKTREKIKKLMENEKNLLILKYSYDDKKAQNYIFLGTELLKYQKEIVSYQEACDNYLLYGKAHIYDNPNFLVELRLGANYNLPLSSSF